jgi:hypothetical protein
VGPEFPPVQTGPGAHPVYCKIKGTGCPDSIETDYGLDGPGIESRWWWDFNTIQTGPGAHPVPCTMGTESYLGVKRGRGVLLTTHPILAPRSWERRAIALTLPGHNRFCYRVILPSFTLQNYKYLNTLDVSFSKICTQ